MKWKWLEIIYKNIFTIQNLLLENLRNHGFDIFAFLFMYDIIDFFHDNLKTSI